MLADKASDVVQQRAKTPVCGAQMESGAEVEKEDRKRVTGYRGTRRAGD